MSVLKYTLPRTCDLGPLRTTQAQRSCAHRPKQPPAKPTHPFPSARPYHPLPILGSIRTTPLKRPTKNDPERAVPLVPVNTRARVAISLTWLEVPMNHAVVVQVVEPAAHLPKIPQCLVLREAAADPGFGPGSACKDSIQGSGVQSGIRVHYEAADVGQIGGPYPCCHIRNL